MVVDSFDLEERNRRWLNIRHAIERSGLDGLLVISDGQLERRGAPYATSSAGEIRLETKQLL